MHEISRVIIERSADSPQVFQQAFLAARKAGFPDPDQIRYASLIVDLFFISHTAKGMLIFLTGHDQRDQPVLLASMDNTELAFETLIPAIPVLTEHAPLDTHVDPDHALSSIHDGKDMEQFTFAASHELKNSLTKLKLAISLLEVDDDPASIHQHIQIILRSAGQLEQVVTDLNSIIRIRNSQPAVSPLSIEEIYNKAQNDLQVKISAAGALISTDFGGISGWTYVESYLQSIFSNLLSNSLKYAAANRKPEIVIKTIKRANGLELMFRDNGQGIDLDKYRKALFTPFSRFSSGQREGKGLGLYIIKSMVERNGGSISIESSPGEGTTVRVLLKEYSLGS